VTYDTFLSDLQAVRDRAGRLRLRAGDDEPTEALAEALQELDATLEELRVAEEEVRTQQEALDLGRAATEADRQRYRALFLLAPAAYLITDPAGLIREANLRAVALLGIDHRFVTGKPPASRWPCSSTSRTGSRSGTGWAGWPVRTWRTGGSGCTPVAAGRSR
jgi:PAS domain-containing protein